MSKESSEKRKDIMTHTVGLSILWGFFWLTHAVLTGGKS